MAVAVVTVMPCTSQGQARPQGGQGVNAQAASMQDFQQRLQKYLDLRAGLARKLAPMSSTTSAAELSARQESLAKALQLTRKNAKVGDLIPAPVAAQIAGTIAADFKQRSAAAERATFSEVPSASRPAINQTYPAQAALPTVPALLLNNLPPLPDNLQYRFYGRHLVILDADVQIIVDFIANVLPPH
jgi:hypothetical protein